MSDERESHAPERRVPAALVLVLVLVLVIVWLAATAWARPLMHPDEGRYASVALQMLSSGDWLTPTLDGLPFFHKPPLFYWLTAVGLSMGGPIEIAARVASIVGGALGAMSLYLFTCRWGSVALARRALLVLLVLPLFYLGSQFANLDMLVAGCITATVLALAHAALSFERKLPYRSMLYVAYALAALGVLAKGLIGLVIPAMVVGLWLLLRKRWRTLLAMFSLPGALIFLLIAAPWFVLMQERFEGFLHYFFVVQHFQRFTETGFNNVQPFWFYPVALLACSVPCILWARRLFTSSYWHQADGVGNGSAGAVRGLMALSVLCVLLFFSLPKSKLIGYILPAVAPLAWLIADASFAYASTRQRWWWLTLACSALISVGVVLGLSLDQRHHMRALGVALGVEHQAHEPVFMLNEYLYDVPFYAHLKDPVFIVEDWDDSEITQRDNWRKEVLDAGQFNPALAQRLLISSDALPQALCHAPVAWLIGNAKAAQRYEAFLNPAEIIHASNGQNLWRVETRKLSAQQCSGTPNAGSAHK